MRDYRGSSSVLPLQGPYLVLSGKKVWAGPKNKSGKEKFIQCQLSYPHKILHCLNKQNVLMPPDGPFIVPRQGQGVWTW